MVWVSGRVMWFSARISTSLGEMSRGLSACGVEIGLRFYGRSDATKSKCLLKVKGLIFKVMIF